MSTAGGTIERPDGTEAAIEPVKQLAGGGARIEIDVEDGPTWTLDVTRTGKYDVVTTEDADGQLADIEIPWWVEEDVLPRLTQ
jgi:hypothetical protein